MNQTIEIFKIGLNNGQFPSYLYKYRGIEATIKLLYNPAIYFSSYEDFLDDFDCFAIVKTTENIDIIRKYLIMQGLTPQDAFHKSIEIARDPKFLQETVENAIKETKKSCGIYCMCESLLLSRPCGKTMLTERKAVA